MPRKMTGDETVFGRIPTPLLAAIVAALLAAGQPFIARLLGILTWSQCYCRGGIDVWGVSSILVTWHVAVAIPGAVLLARRLSGHRFRPERRDYAALILMAGLGVVLATPLVTAQASGADPEGVAHPGIDVLISIWVGVIIGMVAAVGALASVSVARGYVVSWLWTWMLGLLGSLLLFTVPHRVTQPLAGIDVWTGRGAVGSFLGVIAMFATVVGIAVLGTLIGAAQARQRSPFWASLAGGAAGPLLAAVVYHAPGHQLAGDLQVWGIAAIIGCLLSAVGAGIGAALVNARTD